MKDNLEDLDLEKKMQDQRDKDLNEELAALQRKHRVVLKAALVADPLTGIVENKIIKMDMPKTLIDKEAVDKKRPSK